NLENAKTMVGQAILRHQKSVRQSPNIESVQAEGPLKRETDILLRANAITHERGQMYGHPLPNFRRIAGYLNVWFADRLKSPITEEDCPMIMIFTKLAREQNECTDDNILDLCGY